MLDADLEEAYRVLRADLATLGSLIVGFSGGVDSVLLAKVAHEVLGDRMLAVTADSPSLPRHELREAVTLAERAGIPHVVVSTEELEDSRYVANPTDRCYFCRAELFSKLHELAAERGFRYVAYGENVTDGADYRPGGKAALELQVRAPLKDAGLAKDGVRRLAAHLGLPVWDKPEFACLASRVPHGTPVTRERLAQVEAAEDLLRDLGMSQFRVRHHGEIARIEVPLEGMAEVLSSASELVDEFRAIGFRYITLDLAGYQRGSLNPLPLHTSAGQGT